MSGARWAVVAGLGMTGLVVVLTGALIVTVALGGRPPRLLGPSALTSMVSLAAHPYWEVRVTPQQIDSLVQQIEALDAGDMVTVDERFRVCVLKGGEASLHRMWIDAAGTGRVVTIDTRAYRSRPARAQILDHLARELDREEFKPRRKAEPPREIPVP